MFALQSCGRSFEVALLHMLNYYKNRLIIIIIIIVIVIIIIIYYLYCAFIYINTLVKELITRATCGRPSKLNLQFVSSVGLRRGMTGMSVSGFRLAQKSKPWQLITC